MSLRAGLSVVIPVYNSAAIIPELLERLGTAVPKITPSFEAILVNDGSADNSLQALNEGADRYPWVRVINLMRNYGQHNALLCGIRAASYDITVTMDDDLQHAPEDISKLLTKLMEGYDVVYGTPEREQHGLWRDMASRITKLALSHTMGLETARHISAFRLFRTTLRDAFTHFNAPFVCIDVLLSWATTRFTAISVPHHARRHGASNYHFRTLVTHATNMMTGFSTLPLRLASMVGFTFTLFGLLLLCYVIGRYLIVGAVVPGFAFLASAVSLFSGAQLFALGIVGEYLSRMHFRVMDKPSYVIQSPHVASHECLPSAEMTMQLLKQPQDDNR
jgi:glycosyltransferase involved in cell wall biosynthesis